MPARAANPFTTVRSEGALLSPELLRRISDSDRSLGGLTPTDYHLGPTERLNEAISRSWNRLIGLWSAFSPTLDRLNAAADAGTGPTRERWLLPLFSELGFGRLQVAKSEQVDGKTYPISHRSNEGVPIHLIGAGIDLDRRTAGVVGAAKMSPHGLVQQLLNRTPALWGIACNGRRLRLLRDNASLTRQAYLEFDLERMMAGEAYADFALLWLVCHQSRFEGERPADCWLERWFADSRKQGTRALDTLRQGVERALKAFGAGFLAHLGNAALRDRMRTGELSTENYYRQLLRVVYRLIFLFVADDRDLLHPPDASQEARALYASFYSTARLRRLAERRRGTKHHDLYEAFKVVTTKLSNDTDCPSLGMPALGSFLWSSTACPDIDRSQLANAHFLEAIRALAFTEEAKVLRPVDYRNMGSEELGSIYESLLELHPELHAEAATFELRAASGNERKTTGSYYTPTHLITSLLDSALDPVLIEAARKADPEAAILDVKVLDPASGSGHFLVAAAHRIARHLAAVRTKEEEPSPDAYRTALRDAISRCVYGIDLNPMAVELCKISLWMEALDPGKPLSFLDHHIACGNSLLGTNPRLLAGGIPDEAFTALEGDDRAVAQELKRRNRLELTGQEVLALGPSVADFARPLAEAVDELEHLPADSARGLHEKEALWSKIQASSDAVRARFIADAWCAAFLMRKAKGAPVLTSGVLRLLQVDAAGGDPDLHVEIQSLAERYRFLHPHLVFPSVFHVPIRDEEPQHPEVGWSGGFDVVVGNPPWLSYSGRQKVEVDPHELNLMGFLYPEISSWPSSHSAFMLRSLALLDVGGTCGLVAPLQVLHLERYGPLRTRIARATAVVVQDVGEDEFEGVSQRVGLFSFTLVPEADAAVKWQVRTPGHEGIGPDGGASVSSVSDGLTAEVLAILRDLPSFPSTAFADPGVHTGNVSKLIVSDLFPVDDHSYAPVREGRDIAAYFCGPPRKRLWIDPPLEPGQYCTIRPLAVYRDTPVLLRQTADRPIACRHDAPTYFRNSLLACRGIRGVPDEVVVAILNSDMIRRWYQAEVQESGQRAFPQVKIRNLRQLPLFPIDRISSKWEDSTIVASLVARTHDAENMRRSGVADPAVLQEIERLVCSLYGLPEDLTRRLIDAAAAVGTLETVPA